MNQPPDDPIARALVALDRLHAAHPDPAEAAAWQDARTALSEAQGERFTFLVVVAAARKLIADLEGYEAAIEGEDLEILAGLAAACTAAEQALAQALGRVRANVGAAPHPSSDEAHLAATDRFASEDEDDDEETRP